MRTYQMIVGDVTFSGSAGKRSCPAEARPQDQILLSNPVERAKRPSKARSEPERAWTPAQLRAFLDTARQYRLIAFYRLGRVYQRSARRAAQTSVRGTPT